MSEYDSEYDPLGVTDWEDDEATVWEDQNPLEQLANSYFIPEDGGEPYFEATNQDIIEAIAWDLFQAYQDPFHYNDFIDVDSNLTYENFLEAVETQHGIYGAPNYELQREYGRAWFEPGGWEERAKGGYVPDYDYEGFDSQRYSYVYPSDKKHTLHISGKSGNEGIAQDWLAEMSHQMQFYGQPAEIQDSLFAENVRQRHLFGDSGAGKYAPNVRYRAPWHEKVSSIPLIGDIVDFFLPTVHTTGRVQSVYDIEEQPYSSHHGHGHPTVEYEAHGILERELREEIDYFLKELDKLNEGN